MSEVSVPYSLKLICILAVSLVLSCGQESEEESEKETQVDEMYFSMLSADQTGVTFKNAITETDSFNVLNFQNMYNGGGVGLGDINNDGLCDIYLTGNQVSDRLYLNEGDLKFRDITESAIGSLASSGWHTGVVMADVNQDGFLDIYVCRSGKESFNDQLSNLLFINNQNETFTERGEEYGVDIKRATNHAAFLDIDNDNDLDLYVMNRPEMLRNRKNADISDFPYSDVLLENVDGKFIDISKEAGIQNHAHGLGIAVTDLNDDGFADIIISNDFEAQDFMYINKGDNTFRNEVQNRTSHISYFAMGNDVADMNNDGFVDIMTVDMANTDHIASKKNMAGMSTENFWDAVNSGRHYQYMFNSLQLNNGNGTFSEIAQLAGVSKTEWSWAPLFADFDNDGRKDLFVSNGYRRNMTDRDWHLKIDQMDVNPADHEDVLSLIPETEDANCFFRNEGDLKFTKVIKEWKMEEAINSNGAAYADLDNDGDLDLVLNNMEETSCILENKLASNNNYLRVKCDSYSNGVKVELTTGDKLFYLELNPSRGFQSSVENVLHFGLGDVDQIEKLNLRFKDGKSVVLKNVAVNQLLEVKYSEAKKQANKKSSQAVLMVEENILDHETPEVIVDDFKFELLLPHKMSQLGPFMSTADVNGDQLEDFYISGPRETPGTMYLQTPDGFVKMDGPWNKERAREELGSVFIDVENDGDMDLYVVSGSNEHAFNSPLLQDQLYINDGNGNFTNETATRLPVMITSGQNVAAADYDGDGDMDLFSGGRQVPGFYPFPNRSFLLENQDGVFIEATAASKDLLGPGLVTQSVFEDFDADGDLDLICVGRQAF